MVYCTVEDVSQALGLQPTDEDWVVLSADSGASEPNPDRIEVGANKIRRFPVGAQVQIVEMSTPRDETTITRVENATVTDISPGNDYFTVSANLVDDYTVANNAAVRTIAPWHNFTSPSWDNVNEMIREAADEIDNRCHTTFRSGGAVEEQYFEFTTSRRYGSYPYITSYRFGSKGTMYKIKLMHDNIKTLDDTNDTAYTGYTGDALATWQGDNWQEWFNSGDPFSTGDVSIKTQGRDNDYWIDYISGWLFFVSDRPVRGDWNVRIRYRYGEDLYNDATTGSAKRSISKACRLLVQIELISNEQYRVTQPGGEGVGRIPPEEVVDKWEAKVTRLLLPHIEPYMFIDEL